MPQIVGGIDKLIEQLDAVGMSFTTEDLIAGAEVIELKAMELCPVDTGFLRDSAFLQPESDDVLIGFSAEYASYVEFGTYKMAAQPYLRPAIDEASEEALTAIVRSVEANLSQNVGESDNPVNF